MPGKDSPKLEEEYKEVEKKEIEQKIKTNEAAIKKQKERYLRWKVRRLVTDIIYSLVVSVASGFIIWAWIPNHFSIYKALAVGVAWYLLFEELRLHRMFKRER